MNRSGPKWWNVTRTRSLLPCDRRRSGPGRGLLGDDAASREDRESAGRARHTLAAGPRRATCGARSGRPTRRAGGGPPLPARPLRRTARGADRPRHRDIPEVTIPPRDSNPAWPPAAQGPRPTPSGSGGGPRWRRDEVRPAGDHRNRASVGVLRHRHLRRAPPRHATNGYGGASWPARNSWWPSATRCSTSAPAIPSRPAEGDRDTKRTRLLAVPSPIGPAGTR